MKPLAERFWAKVQKTETCWLWTGSKDTRGYGEILVETRAASSRRKDRAHRLAYELTYGPIPRGMQANHHCDTPSCVRPDHIFLGDQSANLRDMWAKGRGGERWVRGESHGNAVLTDEQAAEIRRRYSGKFGEKASLAREYKVCKSTITNVLARLARFAAE